MRQIYASLILAAVVILMIGVAALHHDEIKAVQGRVESAWEKWRQPHLRIEFDFRKTGEVAARVNGELIETAALGDDSYIELKSFAKRIKPPGRLPAITTWTVHAAENTPFNTILAVIFTNEGGDFELVAHNADGAESGRTRYIGGGCEHCVALAATFVDISPDTDNAPGHVGITAFFKDATFFDSVPVDEITPTLRRVLAIAPTHSAPTKLAVDLDIAEDATVADLMPILRQCEIPEVIAEYPHVRAEGAAEMKFPEKSKTPAVRLAPGPAARPAR